MHILSFALAVLFLVLIPIAPQLVRLRIRGLRWLRWDRAANLLENHFEGWVLFLRILMFGLAAMTGYVGWQELRG